MDLWRHIREQLEGPHYDEAPSRPCLTIPTASRGEITFVPTLEFSSRSEKLTQRLRPPQLQTSVFTHEQINILPELWNNTNSPAATFPAAAASAGGFAAVKRSSRQVTHEILHDKLLGCTIREYKVHQPPTIGAGLTKRPPPHASSEGHKHFLPVRSVEAAMMSRGGPSFLQTAQHVLRPKSAAISQSFADSASTPESSPGLVRSADTFQGQSFPGCRRSSASSSYLGQRPPSSCHSISSYLTSTSAALSLDQVMEEAGSCGSADLATLLPDLSPGTHSESQRYLQLLGLPEHASDGRVSFNNPFPTSAPPSRTAPAVGAWIEDLGGHQRTRAKSAVTASLRRNQLRAV